MSFREKVKAVLEGEGKSKLGEASKAKLERAGKKRSKGQSAQLRYKQVKSMSKYVPGFDLDDSQEKSKDWLADMERHRNVSNIPIPKGLEHYVESSNHPFYQKVKG